MDTLTSAKVGIIPESTKYIPVFLKFFCYLKIKLYLCKQE